MAMPTPNESFGPPPIPGDFDVSEGAHVNPDAVTPQTPPEPRPQPSLDHDG